MNRFTLPLSEVKVENRLREDYGDLESLKASIKQYGLIQPIVVNQDKRLIAGGRRYRAHVELGLLHIDVVYKETLDEAYLHELELEENSKRLDQPWYERCLGIAEIHTLRRRRGALEGWSWGQRETAEMFGMQVGTINYVLRVAAELKKEKALPFEDRRYHKFSSINEAWRLGIMQDELDRANEELARRSRQLVATPEQVKEELAVVEEYKRIAKPDEVEYAIAKQRYESNPLNTMPFDDYYKERKAMLEKRAKEFESTVYISHSVLHVDCLEWMRNHPDSVDHIITDPPYAIDMENLMQPNSLRIDMDRVEDAHDEEENRSLLGQFIPLAFTTIRERGFLLMCCDIMLWQYMYDIATEVGFNVQRWPFIWKKTHRCGNACNQFNTTKDFEPVMLCRKKSSVLAKPLDTSFVAASNEQVKKLFGHPFSKPYELTDVLCEAVSTEGQTILEPFAGGGSMVVAMLNKKRKVIALEKEAHHYPALLENIKREHYLKLNSKFQFK